MRSIHLGLFVILLTFLETLNAGFKIQSIEQPRFELNHITMYQGQSNTMSLSLYTDLAYCAIEVELYYDAHLFTVSGLNTSSIFNQVSHQKDLYDNQAGKISFIFAANQDMTINGTILYVTFQAKSSTAVGKYPVHLAVTGLYNQEGLPLLANAKSGSIEILTPDTSPLQVYYSDYVNQSTVQMEDTFDWTIQSYQLQGIIASQYEIHYPKEFLRLQHIELGSLFLEIDTLYDIHDQTEGYINMAFAKLIEVYQAYPLITITFEVIKDVNQTVSLDFSAKNGVNKDQRSLLSNTIERQILIKEKQQELTYPSLSISHFKGEIADTITLDVTLEALSGLAAGDFTISYPANLYEYISYEQVYVDGYLIINHQPLSHQVTFSIIHQDGIEIEVVLFRLNFKSVQSTPTNGFMSIEGRNLINAGYQPIQLSYESSQIELKYAYDVVFKNYDESVLSTQRVLEGEIPVEPTVPERFGTIFIGWNKSINPIYENTVYEAMYLIDMTSIVFENQNIVYDGLTHTIDILDLPSGVELIYQTPRYKDVGTHPVQVDLYIDQVFQTTVTRTIEIKPKEVIVTLLNAQVEEKLALPDFQFEVIGLIEGDDLDLLFSVSGVTTGLHTISAVIQNPNYIGTVVEGVLEVIPFPYMIGDVTKDNRLSIKDIALIQLYLANLIQLDTYQVVSADYNEDGQITITDIAHMQLFIAGRVNIASVSDQKMKTTLLTYGG